MKLNKLQSKAVKIKDKSHLVIASAGSGKTGVLTSRVVHLLNNKVKNILLLTFTVKASEEMLLRVKSQVPEDLLTLVTSGTFHSFGHKMLRKYAEALGYSKNFTIQDAKDTIDLISIISKSSYVKDDKTIRINCSYGSRSIQDIYSNSVNTGRSISEVAKEKLKDIDKKQIDSIKAVVTRYNEYKKKYSIMDFDDLLVNLVELLKIEDVRKSIAKYSHVLVDEFQDTNHLQIQIIKGLLNPETSLFAVGDKNQNIYGFRGASPEHIMNFPQDFNATYTILEQNYRSTQQILDLANSLATKFTDNFKIKMFSTLEGEKPRYIRKSSEEEQADWIAQDIRHKMDSGIKPEAISVLYRVNSTADMLEPKLREYNIPYLRKGGQSLFDKKAIKDIISLLRVSVYKMDTIAWSRALKELPGIGNATTEEALDFIQDKGFKGLLEYKSTRHWDHINRLYSAVKNIKRVKKKPREALEIAIDFWNPIRAKYNELDEEYKESLESLKAIVSKYNSLSKLLVELALSPQSEKEKEKGVTLCTGHSSKGLEWDVVYLANIIEGKMPSVYFTNNKKGGEEDSKIEEELRLFYVMVTRARKSLTICAPLNDEEAQTWKQYGDLSNVSGTLSESRFLADLNNLNTLVTVNMPISNKKIGSRLSLLHRMKKVK